VTSHGAPFWVIGALLAVAVLAALFVLLLTMRSRSRRIAGPAGDAGLRRPGSHARPGGSSGPRRFGGSVGFGSSGTTTGAGLPPEAAMAERMAAAAAPVPRSRSRRREAVPAIRLAEPADLARLSEIEVQGDQIFSRSGLGALPSPGLGQSSPRASVVFVSGRPAVGFARVDEVDGMAHLDQLAVLPQMTRRGIGTALVQAAMEWAAVKGYEAMTLTTFTDSAWNEPVYSANGFLTFRELTPGLVELRDWERAIGLDAMGARIVMRRVL
jgi:GNAT superfamily N-acetyltransferase